MSITYFRVSSVRRSTEIAT